MSSFAHRVSVIARSCPPRSELVRKLERLNKLERQQQFDRIKGELKNAIPADVVDSISTMSLAKDIKCIYECYPPHALTVDDRVRLRSYVIQMIQLEGDKMSDGVYDLLNTLLEERGCSS